MTTHEDWKSKGFLFLLLASQIVVYFVVYGNIPFARATICFLYLMFIPGIVILKLLSLKNLDNVEKVLFSVGLSIAFLMFVGLIVNEIGRLVSTTPLSLNFLLVSINTATLLIALIVTKRGGANLPHLPELTQWLFPILLCISFFVLGSIGILIMNISGNSFLLLVLIIAISAAVPLVLVSEKIFPSRWYPLILFCIGICALYFLSAGTELITKYMIGNGDQWLEFYTFKLTAIKGFWNPTATFSSYTPIPFPEYYSMISLTILPTIFSLITGLDSSLLFKLLYPFVVSFLVLGAYKLYKTQIGNKEAFIAVFFLIIVSVGQGWGPSRQQIAELFYVLLFLLLFMKNISPFKRNVLFIVFSVGLVFSHYSLAYLFMMTLVVAYFILVLIDYKSLGSKRMFSNKSQKITASLVLICMSITFFWYIFVDSSAGLTIILQTVQTVTSELNQFFNIGSRGTALSGLGLAQAPNIFHSLGTAFFIGSEFLLAVGFVAIILNRKKAYSFSKEYKVIAAVNMLIIALNILLPGLANTLLMQRFYQTTLIILAPLAVLGGKALIELIPKPNFRKIYPLFLVFVIFIPLFLFQSGFVYEVAKVPGPSASLSMYRWSNLELYNYIVNDQEVNGAQWLAKYTNTTNIFVYSDAISRTNVLIAYGMMEIGRVDILSNTTTLTSDDYVYLANIDLINNGEIFNGTNITLILQNQNVIYSNGQCEICEGSAP